MLAKRVGRDGNTTSAAQDYMDWHRDALWPVEDATMTDIDSVEYACDDGFPLAFIELKPGSHIEGDAWAYKSALLNLVWKGKIGKAARWLCLAFSAKAWCVLYDFRDPANKVFHVMDLVTGAWRTYTEQQYSEMILTLHREDRERRGTEADPRVRYNAALEGVGK